LREPAIPFPFAEIGVPCVVDGLQDETTRSVRNLSMHFRPEAVIWTIHKRHR